MLVGQSPAAPFSPDEMDNTHSSDQIQPHDSIPPTENASEHPETETSDNQQLADATISHAATASEANQRSQADRAAKPSSGHSSHLDAPAEMSSSAGTAGSDSLQHEETELDYPSTEIVNADPLTTFHATAAAAAETQSVQDVSPDDQSDRPVALASHSVKARSDSLPPTEDAHLDAQVPHHQLASFLVLGGTNQPKQQTHAAPAHAQSSRLCSQSGHAVPAVMLTHLAAAAAAASVPQLSGDQPQLPGDQPQLLCDQPQLPGNQPQLPDDQPQLPDDQSQLLGDQPVVVTQTLPMCSVQLAQGPAIMTQPEHPDHRLTDNGQHQLQSPQARSAEAELAEQDAQFPVVLDQSQLQEVLKPCGDASALSPTASALSPIAAPSDDAPSRPVAPLDAVSQWEAASSCIIVPDSEDPDSSNQHSHSDIGYSASMQSAEQVTPTAVQPAIEAQPSGGGGIQASPAVTQAPQHAACLQCLGQQKAVGAHGSPAVDCLPVQTAEEASHLTSCAQPQDQLTAEQCAEHGVVTDTLLMSLSAKGSQHRDHVHSDSEPVPEHAALPSAVNLPAVKPAEGAQQQHISAAQSLEHVAAPLRTQSQLTFQADAVSEGPDRILAEHETLAEDQILAEQEISAEPEPSAEPEILAEHKLSAEPENLAEPEILGEHENMAEPEILAEHEFLAEPETLAMNEMSAEPDILVEHDIVAEHEKVPEEQALQSIDIDKQARILALSVGDAKDGGANSGEGADATMGSPALKACARHEYLANSTVAPRSAFAPEFKLQMCTGLLWQVCLKCST